MKIPGLKNSLVKMLNQYNLQVNFLTRDDCVYLWIVVFVLGFGARRLQKDFSVGLLQLAKEISGRTTAGHFNIQ